MWMNAEGEIDHLPPFANATNKQLDKEVCISCCCSFTATVILYLKIQVKEQEKYIHAVSRQLEDITARIEVMQGHLKNVQQELMNSQNLYDARTREIETEIHMRQISEREMGRMRSDIEQVKVKEDELKDKVCFPSSNLYLFKTIRFQF